MEKVRNRHVVVVQFALATGNSFQLVVSFGGFFSRFMAQSFRVPGVAMVGCPKTSEKNSTLRPCAKKPLRTARAFSCSESLNRCTKLSCHRQWAQRGRRLCPRHGADSALGELSTVCSCALNLACYFFRILCSPHVEGIPGLVLENGVSLYQAAGKDND